MQTKPRIPTHLRPDLSENMDRTEIWLKTAVNPIDGHKLITQAQAGHLLEKRADLLARDLSPRARWQEFSIYAQDYLAQLPEEIRRPQIVQELNDAIRPIKPFSPSIFLTAEEFAREHRAGGFRTMVRASNESSLHAEATRNDPASTRTADTTSRTTRVKIDGKALDQTWQDFTSGYGITAVQAGAAARKLRSDKPFAPNSVNQQRFLLRKHGVLSPFFQYIHRQPDAFFSALEMQIGRPIALSDRQPLLDHLQSAFATTHGKQGR